MTTIGPDVAQVEYRLDEDAGCSLATEDGQVAYGLEEERPLEWVGEGGLREFGIAPGAALDNAGKDAARVLMDGCDPRTGERLVAAKMAVGPRGELPAAPFAAAMSEFLAERGVTAEELFSADGGRSHGGTGCSVGSLGMGTRTGCRCGILSGSPRPPAGPAFSECTTRATWQTRAGTPTLGCRAHQVSALTGTPLFGNLLVTMSLTGVLIDTLPERQWRGQEPVVRRPWRSGRSRSGRPPSRSAAPGRGPRRR